jgi:hypothetical protein
LNEPVHFHVSVIDEVFEEVTSVAAKAIDSCNFGSDGRYLADSLFAKRPSIYRARRPSPQRL